VLSDLMIRFVLGGLIVSAFAVLGDAFTPKTFAGIFGAAPSVALASLGLAYVTKGSAHASVDGRSMAIGGCALVCYSMLVARLLLRYEWNAAVAAVSSWLAWGTVAGGMWAVLLR